jgi:cyclase
MRTVIGVVLSVALSVASAEAAPSDATARMEQLADGVFAIIHQDSSVDWPSGATDWPHGNTLVVVGDTGVLVVDTTFLPARAEADIALIRAVTDKPVRFVVNTHWHGDHTHGNGVYRKAFPGLSVIGPRENRDFIDVNLVRSPRAMLAADSGMRKTLAELESRLASGRDAEGRELSEALRKSLVTNIAQRRREIAELARVEVVPPDVLFTEELTLFVGSHRVQIRNRGRANSPADVTVYLPDEQILATGDIVVHPVPYAMQSHPTYWTDVLRQLESLPVKALVPGHGPVMRDHSYTRLVRHLLETTAERVRARIREGENNEVVQSTVNLDDIRPLFVKGDDATAIAYWDYSIKKALIERTWACLVGYRC